MKNAAALAAILLTTAVPANAVTTAPTPTAHRYATTMTGLYGNYGPLSGSLTLRIYNDGIVQGTYATYDGPQFIPVTGGLNGNNIWFDIGMQGRIHVDARIQRNGRIVGSAIARNLIQYSFVAQPVS